ncbi:hypothetical protein BGZ98_000418 [Dissophora globulifera]|nr:hypothetical protein BGZ98_000418 [Dissophora globulifera]
MISPLDLLEILERVATYLEPNDLVRACQVSALFHSACTPHIWHSVTLVGNRAIRVWHKGKGFRQGLIHYGPFVRELRLNDTHIRNRDVEFMAVNCTRLKSLDLSYTDITVGSLKTLLHSDPYRTLSASTDNPEDSDTVDANTRMEQYRRILATHTNRDQESGIKTKFPFHLEELIFVNCELLSGPTLFPVTALLGPQLRHLSVDRIADIGDSSDFIRLLKHCPNLTRLNLVGTDANDAFLAALAGATKELAPRAIEALYLNRAPVSAVGLTPLVKISRDKLERLSCPNNDIDDDVIYAFIEDAKELSKAPRPVKSFVRNDVLSILGLSRSVNITHKALLELFRHTTALTMVELDGVDIRDDALEALAAANRNRMERLGLGIPEAWIQHEQGAVKLLARRQKGVEQPLAPAAPAKRKRYDGAWVPGGLQALSLKNCLGVTNQGIRAIARSCPMLWGLNLNGCKSVSMRVFRGPWICNKMQDLNISGINLRIQIKTKSMLLEEVTEDERFPMPLLLKAHPSDDFRDDGHYDYMALPIDFSEENKISNMDITRNDGETRRTLNEFYRKLGQFDQLIRLNMAKSDYRIRVKDGLDLVLPALTKNLKWWNIYRPSGHTLQNVELEWFGKHFGYGLDFTRNGDELDRQPRIEDEYQKLYHDDENEEAKFQAESNDKEVDEFPDEDENEEVDVLDGEDEDEEVDECYDDDEDEEWGEDPNRVSKLKILQLGKCSFEQDNLDRKLFKWFIQSGFDVRELNAENVMSDDE